jgi:type IV protein arginine methyltransferase
VHKLCSDHPRLGEGLRILNVGFGLGIVSTGAFISLLCSADLDQVDGLFQGLSTLPSLHVIIEAHPDVLAHMNEQGWHERPGVKIMAGKWQDIVHSKEFLAFGKFDIIYTDTFAENYKGEDGRFTHNTVLLIFIELYKFFSDLPSLMAGPESRFSFFNGLGATSKPCSFLHGIIN